jgi:ClpX C4-type zinc finger
MDMKRLGRLRGLLRSRRLHCSLCGGAADSIGRLVAGASAHICHQCITKCVAVLQWHGGVVPSEAAETAPGR